LNTAFFFLKQNSLKLSIGKERVVISQVREQNPFSPKEILRDFSRDFVRLIQGGLGNLLAKGIDNLTAPQNRKIFSGNGEVTVSDAPVSRVSTA